MEENIMIEKFRVNPDLQYQYSDIGEYIGEGYTDGPLRNDELVKILNAQDKRIKELEAELENLLKSIKVFSLMEGLNDI